MLSGNALLIQAIVQSPHFFFWKDAQGVYLGCNQNFAVLAGLAEPADILGKKDSDLRWPYGQEDVFSKSDSKVLSGGEIREAEEEILGLDGRRLLVVVTKLPLTDAQGHISGLSGMLMDVTEARKIEAELNQRIWDLQRFREISLDRELKMVSLKREVNSLAKELGRPPVYDLSFLKDTGGSA